MYCVRLTFMPTFGCLGLGLSYGLANMALALTLLALLISSCKILTQRRILNFENSCTPATPLVTGWHRKKVEQKYLLNPCISLKFVLIIASRVYQKIRSRFFLHPILCELSVEM